MKMKEFQYMAPPVLYKYMKYRDSFFNNPVLRFTPINELNDPFELSLACIGFDNSTRQKVQNSYSQPLGPLAEQIVLAQRFDEVARTKNLAMGFGILSLTEDQESILMWSHYADEHRGMVVGIDLQHDLFKQMFLGGNEFPLPVRYGNQRPLYSLATNQHLSGVEGFLGTKGLPWWYEREWRIVTKDFSSKKTIQNKGGFIDLPSECIKEIYLGLRRTQLLVDDAKKFVTRNPHIKLFLGYKAVGAFELNFLELKLASDLFPNSLLA